jgi:hypothetical protein
MVFVAPLHGEHRVTCTPRVSAYSYTVTLYSIPTSLLLFQLPSADSYTELFGSILKTSALCFGAYLPPPVREATFLSLCSRLKSQRHVTVR